MAISILSSCSTDPTDSLQVLSIIYFFNFFISMLFYLGSMQWLVVKLGWLLQVQISSKSS